MTDYCEECKKYGDDCYDDDGELFCNCNYCCMDVLNDGLKAMEGLNE